MQHQSGAQHTVNRVYITQDDLSFLAADEQITVWEAATSMAYLCTNYTTAQLSSISTVCNLDSSDNDCDEQRQTSFVEFRSMSKACISWKSRQHM